MDVTKTRLWRGRLADILREGAEPDAGAPAPRPQGASAMPPVSPDERKVSLSAQDTVVIPWSPPAAGTTGRTLFQGRTAAQACVAVCATLAVLGASSLVTRTLSSPAGGEDLGPSGAVATTPEGPAPTRAPVPERNGARAAPPAENTLAFSETAQAAARAGAERPARPRSRGPRMRSSPPARHPSASEVAAKDAGSSARAAVDAFAAGDYGQAMVRYRHLARAHPSEPAFAEAARILSAWETRREDAMQRP